MGRKMLKRVAQYLLVGAIAMLTACDKGVPEMNEDEQRIVQEYTDSMVPMCVGRFMVDMPERMELAYSDLKVNDAEVSARPMSRQMFERHITRRQRELENMEHIDPEDAPFLKDMVREEDQVIFDRNENTGTYDSSRVLEGYQFLDNIMFEVSVKASDLSDDKYNSARERGRADNKAGRMRQVRYLLGQLRPRKGGEIPEEPGVCFENGFLAMGAEQDVPGHEAWFPIEKVVMRYVDRERRDVYFNFMTDSWLQEETTLLDRSPEFKAALREDDNGEVFREGDVTLDGIDQAAEVLSAQSSQDYRNHIRQNAFYLEANSLEGNRQFPIVMIDFVNGEFSVEEDEGKRIDQASLTDAEAIGLWDAVTRTLRHRPGAF